MDYRQYQRRFEELSPREKDVLAEMAQGLSNDEIARKLFISPHTVKNHITRIYRKLGMDDRTRVALMAVRLGLVSLEAGDERATQGGASEGEASRGQSGKP